MADRSFINSNEFISAFNLEAGSGYKNITPLIDRSVGFSTQRNYPSDLLYVPLKNGDDQDDTVALIHVVYSPSCESESDFDPHKVPIIARVTTHSRYRANHLDYDFKDTDSPTEKSLERTRGTPTPLTLDYYNTFFFDHHGDTFLDSDHKPLTGEQLLNRVFQEHCDTAHRKKGKSIRRKLRYQELMTGIFTSVISFLTITLSAMFGRTLDDSENAFAYLEGYKPSDLKKLSTETLNIFGYKASRRVIILFCVIVVSTHGFKHIFGFQSTYLNHVFSYNLLALTHALIILWLLDVVIPCAIFKLMNWLIQVRKSIAFRKFSV